MRLTILNQFYLPDISPTAQLAGSLAEHRAELGDHVTIICSPNSYTSLQKAEYQHPCRVNVRRIVSLPWNTSSSAGRLLGYLWFLIAAITQMIILRKQDVVIAMTTPPYIVLAAMIHKFIHRKTKVILWIMDCYPEVAQMAGVISKGSWLSRILEAINKVVMSHADCIICLDRSMKKLIETNYRKGNPDSKVVVIANWERFDDYAKPPKQTEKLRKVYPNKAIGLYLGNAGVGHEFETLIAVIEQCKNQPIQFIFIGGGSRWQQLTDAKQQRALVNLTLLGYMPKSDMPAVMAEADFAIITLREQAVGLISPSKLHGYLAMGLPILYIGPTGSNVDDAIEKYGVGYSLRNGNVEGGIDAIRMFVTDPANMKSICRTAFETEFCDHVGLAKFDEVLSQFQAGERPRL